MKRISEIARQGITCIKNAENPYFNSKYADLGAVVEALKKPLEDASLGYYFRIDKDMEASTWMVTMTVVDVKEDAALISAFFPVQSTEPQKMGSAITYAKRYLLTTVFNVIAEEDDDGNEAQGNKPVLQKKAPKPIPLSAASINQQVNDEVPTFFK